MGTLLTIVNFIIVIGFLILIHEGGHFFAARWAQVWVHEFAIGFGPALWKRKGRETLYALRALPIGGYVRMAGETATSAEGGGTEAEEADVPADRLFSVKAPWARMGIIFAGPLTNIVAAVLLMVVAVAIFGAQYIEVNSFTSPQSPAAQALQIGDIVTHINGTPIYSTGQIRSIVSTAGERPIELRILRNGQSLAVSITPEWVPEQGSFLVGALFSLAQTNLITRVAPDSFLAQQGVRANDRIVGIDDHPVSSNRTLIDALEAIGDAAPSRLTVVRDGEALTLALDVGDRPLSEVFQGVSVETPTRTLGLLESVNVGANQTWGMAVMLYEGIKSVFRGDVAAGEAFSGPVGIANILSQGLQQGWAAFFYLVAFLSLNLGIINLLPFPALDGSRLMFISIELIRGKPISAEREGLVHQIGFFILLGLIILVTYNDIIKLI